MMTNPSETALQPLGTQSFRPVTLVDRVVVELNRICRTATLEFALAVGRLIIERLYGNDIDKWAQRGTRCASFNQLSRRPELPMSPCALYRCVATYEVWVRLGGAGRWRHVSSSHIRVVIGLPHEPQARLLESAERECWTVWRLEHEAGQHRPVSSVRGGRPRLPQVTKSLRAMTRLLDSDGNLAGAHSFVPTLDRTHAREAIESLKRIRSACDALLFGVEGALAAEDDLEARQEAG